LKYNVIMKSAILIAIKYTDELFAAITKISFINGNDVKEHETSFKPFVGLREEYMPSCLLQAYLEKLMCVTLKSLKNPHLSGRSLVDGVEGGTQGLCEFFI